MIRFVDIAPQYYAEDDPEDCPPLCIFIDTVTDTFLENDDGFSMFNEESDLPDDYRGRLDPLIPAGYWERGANK